MIASPERASGGCPDPLFIAQAVRQRREHSDSVAGEPGGWMKRPSRDQEREQRITMEIIVDAYGPEEQAMGWYYSLEDQLHFPFVATCTADRSISPLRVGDEVEVVGWPPRRSASTRCSS
jgi:hypothetical protein